MQQIDRITSNGARLATLASAMVLIGAIGAPVEAADTAPTPAEDIRTTYDFEPSTLSYEQQFQLSPRVSQLWDRADADPAGYREALRVALHSDTSREILYCDGGMLLIAKAETPDDRALGIASIKRCSLAEIEQTPYFYTVHQLAASGEDTLALQLRMLAKPRYQAFITPHALTLGQNYSFVYPLFLRDESSWVPRVVDRLARERDSTAQQTLVLALFYAATPSAESALRAYSLGRAPTKDTRAEVKRRLDMIDRIRKLPPADASLKKLAQVAGTPLDTKDDELRARRHARAKAISDEALYELDAATLLIYRDKTKS